MILDELRAAGKPAEQRAGYAIGAANGDTAAAAPSAAAVARPARSRCVSRFIVWEVTLPSACVDDVLASEPLFTGTRLLRGGGVGGCHTIGDPL